MSTLPVSASSGTHFLTTLSKRSDLAERTVHFGLQIMRSLMCSPAIRTTSQVDTRGSPDRLSPHGSDIHDALATLVL